LPEPAAPPPDPAADAFSHAAGLVRQRDRDRYLADLLAPPEFRGHLLVLHAFNSEAARVREVVSEPMPGELRLQWWRDVLRAGEGGGHPVAAALVRTIAAFRLPLAAFDNLLQARIFDLYDDPMPSMAELEGYAGDTSSALFQLAAIILAGGRDPGTADAAGHGGIAYALTGLMRALPIHARRGQSFLPADLLARHGVAATDLAAGRGGAGLDAALAELRGVARNHLDAARRALGPALPEARAALLPLALVEPYLRRMEQPGFDPLHQLADLPQWRRQWHLWRASRRAPAQT
jgi:phytoene synthase